MNFIATLLTRKSAQATKSPTELPTEKATFKISQVGWLEFNSACHLFLSAV